MLWVPMGEASAGLLHPTSSVEAITFQHTLKVCLEDRLKLENIRCSCYAFCCPKTNLLDTLHYSLSRHVCQCVFYPPLRSRHPVLVILCKALGYAGHFSFCLSRP